MKIIKPIECANKVHHLVTTDSDPESQEYKLFPAVLFCSEKMAEKIASLLTDDANKKRGKK